MTKKIDRRIRYRVVLDVETAGGLDNPLVYDIGYVITDRRGKIYEKRSFIIDEIWRQKRLMQSAYYSEKIPMYEKDIASGKRKVVSFETMRSDLFSLMRKYEVDIICAYNLTFDMNALKNTASSILNRDVYFLTPEFKDIETNCIWSLACQVLYTQKGYSKFCVENGYVSEAGNYKTSAEIGYRYITGNTDFIESHTGLEDVLIETEIMALALRQNKKHEKGIIHHPWRIPQDKKVA